MWNFVRAAGKNLEVQLLCRNWILEKKDQDKYNKDNPQVVSGEKKPWKKAHIIKNIADQYRAKCANTRVHFDQRFYEFPPFYQGYIFDDKEAYIGEYEWQKDPRNGGSQYKGKGSGYIRPLTYYSDETELGKAKIRLIISRFEHLWENSKTYEQVEVKYLFSWDDVPGNDNVRLIRFLKQKFGIGWVKTAKIEKIDDGKTIRVSFENNFLSLRLNDKKTKVNLKIDDDRTDEFIVKQENGKLNIYEVKQVKEI